ncbi:uncharacterized protein LOC118434269 [Folsomia candida]|uniref:uncharacterized protein LOC118434269 n=1 Tax=Folsomia candida TaxID=158441 RepID=UPI0016051C01|nr:uncharacterized protein LOC118434269 [Folsomia candida]
MAQQFTPWQKMRAYETQVRKLEDNWRIRLRKKGAQDEEDNVIVAEPFECSCKNPLTYFNNGKCNYCCKQLYDYNYLFYHGYDQYRHREDRKHATRYMNIDLEEEFPCRTVPILTSSNYGHRPPIDPSRPLPRNHATQTFYRSRGTNYCIDANGYNNVKLNPTTAFRYNAQFGYTFSPPRN